MQPAIARHLAGIAAICQHYQIRKLDAFGSAARATDFDPERSGADFVIEFAPDARPDLHSLYGVRSELKALLGRPVDLIEAGAVRNLFMLAANRQRQNVLAPDTGTFAKADVPKLSHEQRTDPAAAQVQQGHAGARIRRD